MKHYLINGCIHTGSCSKVIFYEILNEQEYRFYMQVKLRLKRLDMQLDLLTTVNILQFEPIEISDMDYSILNRYKPKGALYPTSELYEYLIVKAEEFNIELPEWISEITDEQLIKVVDAIAK